jgi:hypothetical protein
MRRESFCRLVFASAETLATRLRAVRAAAAEAELTFPSAALGALLLARCCLGESRTRKG